MPEKSLGDRDLNRRGGVWMKVSPGEGLMDECARRFQGRASTSVAEAEGAEKGGGSQSLGPERPPQGLGPRFWVEQGARVVF